MGVSKLAGGAALAVVLHVRLPAGLKVTAVTATGTAGTKVTWQHVSGVVRFEMTTGSARLATA